MNDEWLSKLQDISRLRPSSPKHLDETTARSNDSPPSSSPSQQTSLRVFRNISSKHQPQSELLLRNNNSIQRSESSRMSPSPSPPRSSSPSHFDEVNNRMNNSPLDFTSKKVNQLNNSWNNATSFNNLYKTMKSNLLIVVLIDTAIDQYVIWRKEHWLRWKVTKKQYV